MIVAALPQTLPIGIRWFKAPDGFTEWGHAGQCLWNFLLWNSRLDDDGRPFCRAKDWEIARATGYTLAWVQKALRQLVGLSNDENDPTPAIERERVYGHIGVAGRLIRIILPLAGPQPKKAEPAKSPPVPVTNTVTPPAPPQCEPQFPAALPEPTPEEVAATAAMFESIRRKFRHRPAPEKLSPQDAEAEMERRRAAAAARFGTDRDLSDPKRE